MVSAPEGGSPTLDPVAARENGGRRITPGQDPEPAGAGLEPLPQPLKSRETSLLGVGCTITITAHESDSSWRCVVELPARMAAAAVIGDARSRERAVTDAFRRAEGALGWGAS